MAEEIREEVVTPTEVVREEPTHDAEKGAVLGGVGGLVTGAIAGATAGPAGAVVGAVVGGVLGAAASAAAVGAVDKIDDDHTITGFPDDADLEGPDVREPVVIDRSQVVEVPDTAIEPVGLGVQETVIATTPPPVPSEAVSANTGTVPATSLTAAEIAPTPDEGVTADAEIPGNVRPIQSPTDGGWERDNDANQIDINPQGISYPYADRPNED